MFDALNGSRCKQWQETGARRSGESISDCGLSSLSVCKCVSLCVLTESRHRSREMWKSPSESDEFDQAKFTFGLIVCRRGIKASVCFKLNASQSYHQPSVVNRFHNILLPVISLNFTEPTEWFHPLEMRLTTLGLYGCMDDVYSSW